MNREGCLYEVRVAETLESHWSGWFTEIEIVPAGEGGTLLRGRFPDQAALYGLLGRLRDFNLTLVEVRRVE